MSTLQKEVSMVFVHRDRCLLDTFSYLASSSDREIDTYWKPQEFLANAHRYSKHTKIILGRTFNNVAQHGVHIAEQLHGLGYTRLYLVSLLDMLGNQVPDYLSVINASEIDELIQLVKE